MRHAQAHQHECGEQEKHDVDQRDDLDAGFITLVITTLRLELYRHQRADLFGEKFSRS